MIETTVRGAGRVYPTLQTGLTFAPGFRQTGSYGNRYPGSETSDGKKAPAQRCCVPSVRQRHPGDQPLVVVVQVRRRYGSERGTSVDWFLVGMSRIRRDDPESYRLLRQKLLEGLKSELGEE